MRFDSFTVRVKGEYSLQVMLPFPVQHDDEFGANFNATTHTFTVTVPVSDYLPPGWLPPPTASEQHAEPQAEAQAQAEVRAGFSDGERQPCESCDFPQGFSRMRKKDSFQLSLTLTPRLG